MKRSEHIITSKHYLVLCVIAFAAGIFFFINFNISFCIFVGILLLLALVSFSVLFVVLPLIRQKPIRPRKHILLPSALIIFFILGMLRAFAYDNTSSKTLRNYANESVRLYGYVNSVPRLSGNGYSYSFDLDVSCIESDGKTTPASGTVLMYISNKSVANLKFSDHISCWAELKDTESTAFPDNHDYNNYLKSKNVFMTGNAKGYIITPPITARKVSFIDFVKKAGIYIHEKISLAIDSLFVYDQNDNALLKGILIGDKTGMTSEFKQQLSNAGISHIAAVSGMHMSILFSAIIFLLSQFKINRKISLMLSVPLILLFASTAAFTPSVCRSAIMITIVIISSLTTERYSSITSLFSAVAIILIFSPYALFSSGFVLSCFSVLGILVYFKYLKYILNKILPARNILSPILTSFSLSASTFIGTAYFSIIFFDSVSVIQFITNLWVIPLVSVVFCLAYPLCIAYFILPEFVIKPFLYVTAGALRLISKTVYVFGKDNFVFSFPADSVPGYFHAVYFGFAVLLYFLLKLLYDMLIKKETADKNDRFKLYY